MTRDDTRTILDRRLRLTGDSYNAGMVDTWHELLDTVDLGEAVVAMTRAAKEHGHVQWKQFADALASHRHGLTNARDDRPTECGLCDGTGWKDAGPDRAGNTSVEPCTHHIPPGRVLPPAEGFAIMAQALADELVARGHPAATAEAIIDRWYAP